MHTVSLADVIGAGKPVAVMFATPARCQTEYCGPVLDELLGVKAGYEQRGAAFVHVEIYLDNSTTAHSPTVDAWAIDSEPWLYTLDGTGKIVGRTGGAMGREEIVAQLDALVGITS